MMTTARKSFLLSLMFHSLMGSLAFMVLVQMRTPPPMLKIQLQHMTLVSLSDSKPIPKRAEISEPTPAITPPQPTPIKPLVTQPIVPTKAINPQPIAPSVQAAPTTLATPTPIVTTAPVADVTPPPKAKINTASELQSFKASLRTKIKQNLRYPSAARRRGMEGEVSVRFTVFADGSIREIAVRQGEDIFHNAAKAAVASSSGIDVPKSLTESLPMEMDLILEFKLNS
ncbi:MAG: TonB family protein [Sulfuricurvum sp.]|uniref:TonB family protein n=1 Tax=Sulfuricurvum sp. TaxID=2025608 RepID=UPI0026044FF6|nr:TonB family protein [Sulfuricurvum sp.]MDD5159889.1 TonB family protein [Sulfuricurvum sp.]